MGYKLDSQLVTKSTNALNKDACIRECRNLNFCRTFAYSRYQDSGSNCQLTSIPVSSLTSRDRRFDSRWNICELENRIETTCLRDNVRNTADDGDCYNHQCSGYRHYSGSYVDALRVQDKDECSQRCSRTSYCRSFSYQYFVSNINENCLLSPREISRLNPELDLVADSNWDLYEQQDAPGCRLSVGDNDRQYYDDDYYDRDRGEVVFRLKKYDTTHVFLLQIVFAVSLETRDIERSMSE